MSRDLMIELRDGVLGILDQGGPVVALLACLSLAVLSVVLYKLWQFAASGVGRHRALRAAIDAWDRGDRGGARRLLAQSRSHLRVVVNMAAEGQTSAERLLAEAETRFARLERGFRLMDSVAQVAPLLGLFGTVLGMISAFQALQAAGDAVDPALLAGGIWVALLTTAVGLAVAMPTSLILGWFESRIEAERVLVEHALFTLLSPNTEARMTEAHRTDARPGLRAHA